MKVSDKVKYRVGRLQKGFVFTYSNIVRGVESEEAVIKALNRMVNAGTLKRLSKGRYFKPEITPFGELQPEQDQVVKDILKDNGYLTGLSIFHQQGLTTQVGSTIQIGKNDWRPSFKRDYFTIKYLRQKNIITRERIPLLQILDSIRLIRSIPDTNLTSASKRLISIIEPLKDADIRSMVKLVEKYPASTKALLGLFLGEAGKGEFAPLVSRLLNPITTYNYREIASSFPNATNWNIK